jgi:DNA-binding transcriptional LysR family regulator
MVCNEARTKGSLELMKRVLTSRSQNRAIRIASDGTGDEILTARLSTYLRKHPKIDVDVIDASGSEVVRLLSDRKVDLGIAVLPTTGVDAVRAHPFAAEKRVIVTPLRHALTRRPSWRFRDTLDFEYVRHSDGWGLPVPLEVEAIRYGKRLMVRMSVSTQRFACCAVSAGAGISIVDSTVARNCREAVSLGIVALAETWACRRASVCLPRARSLPLRVRELAACLRSGSAR